MSSLANAALGDVLVEARPGFACGDDAADGVFQFRMNNITTEGQLDLSKKRRVPRDSRNIDRYLVESGDVLFNGTVPTLWERPRTFLVSKSPPSLATTFFGCGLTLIGWTAAFFHVGSMFSSSAAVSKACAANG